VTTEFLPFDGYFDKLATTSAGGDAPDLMAQNFAFLPQYVTREALLPLDGVNEDVLDSSAVTQGVFDGVRYAVPAGANTQAILYDPEVFAAAGVDVPDSAWTWDDFEQVAQDLVASGATTFASNDPSGLPWVLDFWLTQEDKTFYTDEGDLGFTEQDLVEYWERFAQLRDSGLLPTADVTAEITGDSATTTLARGLAAMEFNYSATVPGFTGIVGKELQLLPLPNGSQPGQYLIGTGIMWSVAATTEHPETVIDLLNFLITDPGAINALGLERGVPFSQDARDEIVASGLEGANAIQVDFVSQIAGGELAAQNTYYTNPPRSSNEIATLFLDSSQRIAFGQLSIADAAAEFIQQATAILDADS
jgi:multiple sugar transport system substrate-binding protein